MTDVKTKKKKSDSTKKKKVVESDQIESFDFDLGFNLNEVYDQ